MSKKTKNKKMYYRRARWDEQGNDTLEKLLKEAHVKFSKTGDRTFPSPTNELKGADFKSNDKGLFLHIVSYVPDQPTSTIDKDKLVNSATISIEPAPAGKDFMDGDIFVLVKDNHVILCPSGIRENVVAGYFCHILKKFKLKQAASTLELDKVSNASKLKMIKKEGVKEILISSSLYQASLHELERDQSTKSKILAPIAAQYRSIFAMDSALRNITELENLNVMVTLKFDGAEGRKKHKDPEFGDAGRQRLERTAEMVLNEADDGGFVIITGAGNKITADEVRIADSIAIKVHGKSLNCLDAWEKLARYFDKLKTNGVLSQ